MDSIAISVHLDTVPEADVNRIVAEAQTKLQHNHGIDFITVQVSGFRDRQCAGARLLGTLCNRHAFRLSAATDSEVYRRIALRCWRHLHKDGSRTIQGPQFAPRLYICLCLYIGHRRHCVIFCSFALLLVLRMNKACNRRICTSLAYQLHGI